MSIETTEPVMRDMESVEAVISVRGGRYGDFSDEAALAQQLLDMLMSGPSWKYLTAVQRQSLQMMCVKQARIVIGDPNYADNWLDIEGYARLARERLGTHDPRQGFLDFDKRGEAGEIRAGWTENGYRPLADRLTAAAREDMADRPPHHPA